MKYLASNMVETNLRRLGLASVYETILMINSLICLLYLFYGNNFQSESN